MVSQNLCSPIANPWYPTEKQGENSWFLGFVEYSGQNSLMKKLQNRINPKVRNFIIILISIVTGIALFWTNFRYVQENPDNILFLDQWVTTRTFIIEGRSPYDNVIAQDIQDQFHDNQRQVLDKIPQSDLPLYITLLITPFSMIGDYDLASGLWMTILEIAIISMVCLSVHIVGWRISLLLLPIYLIFSILTFHGLYGIIDGNIAILVALFIVSCFYAIRDENNLTAGFFLAFSTIRPKLTILLIIYVLIWAIRSRKWAMVRWFFIWLIIFFCMGMIFIPDWLLQNIRVVVSSDLFGSIGTLGNIFTEWLPGIGSQLYWLYTISLTILLILEWWLVKVKEYRHFLWTAALTMTVSQLVGFTTHISDSVLLFFPLVLIFSIINDRYEKWGFWIVISFILIILVGTWALAIAIPGKAGQFSIATMLNFPFYLFIFLGLYWVRWWVIRSPMRLI